jgi:hypothetical protein
MTLSSDISWKSDHSYIVLMRGLRRRQVQDVVHRTPATALKLDKGCPSSVRLGGSPETILV